jgi:hypothetical protein
MRRIVELPAACYATDHFSHPACTPLWRRRLPPGAVILGSPWYDGDRGWVVRVALPTRRRRRRRSS